MAIPLGDTLSDLNLVEIDNPKDSTITNISLYSSKAEVSRLYKFTASPGANELVISNLPNSLENATLRRQLNIVRCKRCIEELEKYLDTLSVQHADVTQLFPIMENYESTTKTSTTWILAVEKELAEIEAAITAENDNGHRIANFEQ